MGNYGEEFLDLCGFIGAITIGILLGWGIGALIVWLVK